MRPGNCGNVAVIATLSDKITGFGIAVEVQSIFVMILSLSVKNVTQRSNRQNKLNSSKSSLKLDNRFPAIKRHFIKYQYLTRSIREIIINTNAPNDLMTCIS